LLEEHGIDVWLNGGWGVDALLGHQTREHEDLDITISSAQRAAYSSVMEAAGFGTYRVDRTRRIIETCSPYAGHSTSRFPPFSNSLVLIASFSQWGTGCL
jgi:hypothetical protein